MKRAIFCGLLLVSAVARADDKRALVNVDDEVITVGNLRGTADGLGPRGAMMVSNPVQRRQLVDQMVDNRLIARQAAAEGLEKTDDYQRMLAEARVNILANLYQRKVLAEGLTDAKIEAFFRANQQQFAQKKIHASHIQVKDEATAASVQARAAAPGADFAALARQYSQAAGASKGGDLGWFGRGRMLAEFEDAAFACPVGLCPKPVKTRFGWHVIKVHEIKGGDEVAFAAVKDQVKAAYERRLKDDLVARLRGKAKVAVHEEALRDFKL